METTMLRLLPLVLFANERGRGKEPHPRTFGACHLMARLFKAVTAKHTRLRPVILIFGSGKALTQAKDLLSELLSEEDSVLVGETKKGLSLQATSMWEVLIGKREYFFNIASDGDALVYGTPLTVISDSYTVFDVSRAIAQAAGKVHEELFSDGELLAYEIEFPLHNGNIVKEDMKVFGLLPTVGSA